MSGKVLEIVRERNKNSKPCFSSLIYRVDNKNVNNKKILQTGTKNFINIKNRIQR